MKTESLIFPNRWVWKIAGLVAVGIGLPLSFLSKEYPWVIAIPIGVGTVMVIAPEIFRWFRPKQGIFQMPAEYLGLSRYTGHLAIAIEEEEEPESQAIFGFALVRRRRTPERVIVDPETGDKIFVVNGDRFIELVLKHLGPASDKATEVSLLHALHRYGEMKSISNELEQFLRDKTVLEVLKTDFRGNYAQMITRCAEAVFRELGKRRKETKPGRQPAKK